MTLQFLLDSLDNVADEHKGLYQEVDGKFQLNVGGLPEPEDVSGLKSALAAERNKSKDISKWQKLGKSPEEIAALIQAETDRKNKKLKDEGDFDAILAQHQENWDTEKQGLVSQNEASNAALQSFVGKGAFVAELAKKGATTEGVDALPQLFAKRIKVTVEGTEPKIEIMMADGVTPMAGNSGNGTATIEDLVGDAIKQFPSLFKEPGAGGGGKPQGDGAGGSDFSGTWSEAKTPKDKVALLKAKNGS